MKPPIATIKRYAVTHTRDGVRIITNGAWDTKEEAEAWRDAILENNSPDKVRQIFGDSPDFRVMLVECWPTHGNPTGYSVPIEQGAITP